MSAGAQFHEVIASTWTQGYQSGSFRKRLEIFRRLVQSSVEVDSSWLDLGCGSGVLTHEILRCNPASVTAVDGSPSMLENAKALIAASSPSSKVDWHLSDVSSLPFLATASQDGVLCSSVIEYLQDPAPSLREMRRVLRLGGRLLVSVPISTSWVRRGQKTARHIGKMVGRDVYPYLDVSQFDIRLSGAAKLLEPAGFKCLAQQRFDPIIPESLHAVCHPSLLVIAAEAC